MKKTIAAVAVAITAALTFPVIVSAQDENAEIVTLSEVPAAAQTTIKDQAGSNEIVRIEKKTEDGETVYDAIVNRDGREWTIEVNENGNILKEYDASSGDAEPSENS